MWLLACISIPHHRYESFMLNRLSPGSQTYKLKRFFFIFMPDCSLKNCFRIRRKRLLEKKTPNRVLAHMACPPLHFHLHPEIFFVPYLLHVHPVLFFWEVLVHLRRGLCPEKISSILILQHLSWPPLQFLLPSGFCLIRFQLIRDFESTMFSQRDIASFCFKLTKLLISRMGQIPPQGS